MKKMLVGLVLVGAFLAPLRLLGHECSCHAKDANFEVRELKVIEKLSGDREFFEQELEQAMRKTPNGSYNIPIERLLALLDAEMLLVDNLINGVTGYAMQCAIDHRNKQMAKTPVFMVDVYEKIMGVATFDERLYSEYKYQWSRHPKHCTIKLAGYEKREFLRNMHEIISDYYDQFLEMQYRQSTQYDTRMNIDTEGTVSGQEPLRYCPIV